MLCMLSFFVVQKKKTMITFVDKKILWMYYENEV